MVTYVHHVHVGQTGSNSVGVGTYVLGCNNEEQWSSCPELVSGGGGGSKIQKFKWLVKVVVSIVSTP